MRNRFAPIRGRSARLSPTSASDSATGTEAADASRAYPVELVEMLTSSAAGLRQ